MATVGRRALIAGATLGASAALAGSAQAAGTTYTVQTNGDGAPGSCSGTSCPTLRDAINTAKNGDTIEFASGLTGKTITLSSGQGALTISHGVTIANPNAPGLAVSGGNTVRVFDVAGPVGQTISISGLTIEDGSVPTFGGGETGGGGAILNQATGGGPATLSLSHDVVKDSSAVNAGGGISSYGPLDVSASTITGDHSPEGGGISVFAPSSPYQVKIENTTISNNGGKFGAGLDSYADDVSVTGSTITGNSATSYGGGISTGYGSLSLSHTTVSGNTAPSAGGVGSYTRAGTTISDSTLSGNTATGFGGGLEIYGSSAPASGGNPISVTQTTISGNKASGGAGIDLAADAAANPVTIAASTISGNSGTGGSSFGGGLLVEGTQSSPFKLIDSTISGNNASDGGGVSLGDATSRALLGSGGSIALDNSTIAGNSASASGGGGGIFLSDYSSGSPAKEKSGTASLFSTIVGGNTAAGAKNDLAQAAASTSGGFDVSYSLLQAPGNATLLTQQAVIKGVDPQLGALANNGGSTQTMRPAYTSPVIDQGKASSGLNTDQRGDSRTVNNGRKRPAGGDGTDIGAVEVGKVPLVVRIQRASAQRRSSAKLHGRFTTNGEAVRWHFQYGRTKRYGKSTPSRSISAGRGQVPVSFTVRGLAPGALYHYRLVGVNAAGVRVVSGDRTFRTRRRRSK